jgi:hypothetical protein
MEAVETPDQLAELVAARGELILSVADLARFFPERSEGNPRSTEMLWLSWVREHGFGWEFNRDLSSFMVIARKPSFGTVPRPDGGYDTVIVP